MFLVSSFAEVRKLLSVSVSRIDIRVEFGVPAYSFHPLFAVVS